MSTLKRLHLEKKQAGRDALERLRFNAPAVYRHVIGLIRSRGGLSGLGEFDWADLADTLLTVKASKEISNDERKAADKEIQLLREKTALLNKQVKAEKELQESKNRGLTLAQQAGMVGDSVIDQLMAKPWAVPALLGLGFALFRSMNARRRR
jgi:hypothetical protein